MLRVVAGRANRIWAFASCRSPVRYAPELRRGRKRLKRATLWTVRKGRKIKRFLPTRWKQAGDVDQLVKRYVILLLVYLHYFQLVATGVVRSHSNQVDFTSSP